MLKIVSTLQTIEPTHRVNEARLTLVRAQERLIASEQSRREKELAVLVSRRTLS